MKSMKIEKQLLFTDSVKQIRSLHVKDGLSYQKESDGIRALGPLFIKGEYEGMDGSIQSFQEVLDMDILAPTQKLGDDQFFIQVKDYQGVPENDSIHLYITMQIHGLKEEKNDVQGEISKKDIATQKETNAEVTLQKTLEPAQLSPQHPSIPQQKEENQNIDVEEETVKQESQNDSSTNSFEEFEDLFEDTDTTYTSYRMIVAQPQDTYASIAQRYNVDEADLRTSNHDKDISHKTLVILP